MSIVKPRTLSGFMELLPRDQMKMERMMQILRETYSLFAFTPLDTPVIEAAEVLLAKGGGETEKQIYRFQKGDNDLALRFDLTVPLAKYVAAHYAELAFPFRRYQIGKVYRGERAQRGRFREFYQADIDVIGDGKLDIINEAEIPAIIYTAFTRLGLKNFKIRVNNRKILNGFYSMNGMSEKAQDIMRIVDKLDKVGEVKIKQMLIDELDMRPYKAENVLDFMAIKGSNAEILERLEIYRGMDETFDLGLEELRAQMTEEKRLYDSFSGTENFVIPGISEDSWIVYIRTNGWFKKITASAPILMRAYVERGSDGTYYIKEDSLLTEEEKAAVAAADASETVRKMNTEYRTELAKAIVQDGKLGSLYERLREGAGTDPSGSGNAAGNAGSNVGIAGSEESTAVLTETESGAEQGETATVAEAVVEVHAGGTETESAAEAESTAESGSTAESTTAAEAAAAENTAQ